jgi:Fe2+ transport system protein FeoA
MQKSRIRLLSELSQNSFATVVEIDHQPSFTIKAAALGLKVNKTVSVLHKSNNGPMCIKVNTSSFMIRAADAAKIKVIPQ